MRALLATLVLQLVTWDLFPAVTITSPPKIVKMGSFPDFSFTISGVTNSALAKRAQKDSPHTWWGVIMPVLVKVEDDLVVGYLTFGDRSPLSVVNGNYMGKFSWGLTVILTEETTTWPELGRYKIKLGIMENPLLPLEFQYSAETEEFTLEGELPPMTIHRYQHAPNKIWIYVSGKLEEQYTLLRRSSLDSYYEFEWESFEIPLGGLYSTCIENDGGESGFFRLRKNEVNIATTARKQ